MPSTPHARRGTTLPELVVVLTISAILAAIAVSSAVRLADVLAVRGATREVRSALWTARDVAVLRSARTAIRFDTARGRVFVHGRADTVLALQVRAVYGARLSVTRDSIAYGADGLGYGAANARVVVWRRGAVDSITISRLGRVR